MESLGLPRKSSSLVYVNGCDMKQTLLYYANHGHLSRRYTGNSRQYGQLQSLRPPATLICRSASVSKYALISETVNELTIHTILYQ
jgi:hypothetical protein